ncbi:MAG: hypothetical protein EAZ61_07945 [Oscillatoriales cyanobacterium]|nr:MAG: hypothetical protein EAZ61_07945 [Oscillatoriales cyanobacterium]
MIQLLTIGKNSKPILPYRKSGCLIAVVAIDANAWIEWDRMGLNCGKVWRITANYGKSQRNER